MKLNEILERHDTILLDQISSDKIDETISLRLPRTVFIQEIISALSSLSYISDKITYAKPPTFAILNLILHSPDNTVEIEGFREKVLSHLKELSNKADSLKDFSGIKNYQLYIKILNRAWENDGSIDKSESFILELVKVELGIWDREHFVLGHHSSILKLWDVSQEYYTARNFLLSTGIILTENNKYLIADEVAVQIRRAFGMEIKDDSYKRMLSSFTKEELAQALQSFKLLVSGSKDELVERVINALIPPTDLLNIFQVETLRDFCRQNNIQISGTKNVVVNNIIQFYAEDSDLVTDIIEEPESHFPSPPEIKELDKDIFIKILFNLSNQQLYDILHQSYLTTSGTKEEKVSRLLESPWSERSIFNRLRKEDLSLLCKKFGLPISGAKQELVDRILDVNFLPKTEEIILSRDVNDDLNLSTKSQDKNNELQKETKSPLPTSFAEIDTAFPELDQDEKVIVSVIKDIKSLSEQELERVVIKHKLGWFLHKAHMSEIIAKLKRNKKNFIRIKSVQNTNIYQWAEDANRNETIIEKKSARDIIDALRHGVVPKNNLDLLIVGQQNARKHLSEILNEVNQNKSHFKFIRGQYGAGKTFLCSWLKEYALEKEFAVSFLNISHDQPLSELSIFFSGMINGLRTPEKSDSGALVDILESWLLNTHKKTAQIEGASTVDLKNQSKLTSIVEKNIESELSLLNDIEPGFSQALRAFYKGKFEGNQILVSNAIAWITGSRSLSTKALKEIGVKGYLEANNVFPRMRAILQIISGARYKGLLLLVDELELVRKFPHIRQREQALETLRLLIDESGKNALPGCLIVFTGTDEFFEDERFGLKSYEALAERVLTPLKHDNFVSMRQPIISLESLDKERLANVIFKIRDLYGLAYNWDSKHFADDSSILKLIDSWTLFGDENIGRKPRPILREFIHILDLCEENKGLSLENFLNKNVHDESIVTENAEFN